MVASENRFAPELNEKEVIELLESATPGSIKKATKYGMEIFQGKNLKTLTFDNLSIRVCQSKTMQVETIYTFKNFLYIAIHKGKKANSRGLPCGGGVHSWN